jgi:hypothetical protein
MLRASNRTVVHPFNREGFQFIPDMEVYACTVPAAFKCAILNPFTAPPRIIPSTFQIGIGFVNQMGTPRPALINGGPDADERKNNNNIPAPKLGKGLLPVRET